MSQETSTLLSPEQGKTLLDLAKESVRTALADEELKIHTNVRDAFQTKQGVFVTITENDQLRGCIGFPQPVFPLWEAVVRAARAAAFEDPRFPQIEENEFEDLRFEISVLTVPQPLEVQDPDELMKTIIIGRDGLIIECDGESGLLLPQVATEWKWTQKQFLEHLCMKADLHKDAWRSDDAVILTFQAQIFSEKE